MIYLEYILKIFLYFFVIYIIYLFSNNSYVKKNKKLSIFLIILFSIFMGVYSIYCGQAGFSSDRGNYALKFSNDIYSTLVYNNSVGLYYLEKVLHFFSYNPKLLYFSVTFIYYFITLLSYNNIEEATPKTLLLLGLSTYGLLGFYLFKQALAIAFISLAYSFITKDGKKLKALLCVLVAITFHESAWIVVPLYFASTFSSKGLKRYLTYFLLIICTVFFDKINTILISLFNYIPNISVQISSYLNEDGGISNQLNYATALKGIPFYIITILGIMYRKNMKDKIVNYDFYMILCFFASITSILSVNMYWMWRLGTFCYFPIFIFFSNLSRMSKKNRNTSLLFLSVYLIMFGLNLKLLIQYYFKYGGF